MSRPSALLGTPTVDCRRTLKFIRFVVGFAIIAYAFQFSVQAQTAAKIPITTTVTVLGPKFTDPPPIAKEDVDVFSGSSHLDVIDWVPAKGRNGDLQLAIVIDSSLRPHGEIVGIDELTTFLALLIGSTQPAKVGIFYARNGTVEEASPFGSDYEVIAKSLRSPPALFNRDSSSLVWSLSDLIQHYFPSSNGRREILLMTGLGATAGVRPIMYDNAIEDAQKAGIQIHSIIAGSIDNPFLLRATMQSGGYYSPKDGFDLDYLGLHLRRFGLLLEHQYLATFEIEARANSGGDLRALRIRTRKPGVELRHPKMVWVPGSTK